MDTNQPQITSNTQIDLKTETDRLVNAKLQIEIEKLEIEKKQLKSRWYFKPQWWSVLVPLIIGAGTIFIAFSTGIISVERLKNEKEELTKTIAIQKDSLKYYENKSNNLRDSMMDLVKIEQKRIEKLKSFNESLNAANETKNKYIRETKKDQLNRINQEIRMNEDTFWIEWDKSLGDTTSKKIRKERVIELKKVRTKLMKELGQ